MSFFANTIRPSQKTFLVPSYLLSIVGGSLFIALMSQITIPLWFTPVPLTMQSFAIFMLAALLGGKKAAFAVMAYLAEGALGLPFYAGAKAGFLVLVGPTGGYLFGFIACAFIAGTLLEKGWVNHFLTTIFALLLGCLSLFAIGCAWLSLYVGFEKSLTLGVFPFLLGDMLKVSISALMIPLGRKFFR